MLNEGGIIFSSGRAFWAGALGLGLLACGGRAAIDDSTQSGFSTSSSGFGGTSPSGAPAGGRASAGTSSSAGGGGASAGMASVCPADLPSAEEVAQTPRKDQSLEFLALKLADGVIAVQADYDRVVRDVAAIHALAPELADITYQQHFDGQTITINTSLATANAMTSGEYHAWDCLNSRYVVLNTSDVGLGSFGSVELRLKGIYDTAKVAKQYSVLPNVMDAEVGGNGFADGPTICLTRENSLWHYVLDRASGDCIAGCTTHEYHHFTTTLAGQVTSLGLLTDDQVQVYASYATCH